MDYILLKISGTKPLLSARGRKKRKIFKKYLEISQKVVLLQSQFTHTIAESASSLKRLAGLKKKSKNFSENVAGIKKVFNFAAPNDKKQTC